MADWGTIQGEQIKASKKKERLIWVLKQKLAIYNEMLHCAPDSLRKCAKLKDYIYHNILIGQFWKRDVFSFDVPKEYYLCIKFCNHRG